LLKLSILRHAFEFADCPGLNLPNSFLADTHFGTKFTEGLGLPSVKAKPGDDNLLLAWLKVIKKSREEFPQVTHLMRRAEVRITWLLGSVSHRLIVAGKPGPLLTAFLGDPEEMPLDRIRGVRAKPISQGEVELFDRSHQGDVALTDQLFKRKTRLVELLGDRDN
jgi:hypothetical protein